MMATLSHPVRLVAAIPPEVERATEDAIDARNGQLERVGDSVLDRLNQLSQNILAQVAAVVGTQLSPRLRQLSDTIAGLTEQWTRDVTTLVQSAQTDAVDIGQDLIDAPLIAAGVNLIGPDVSLELLQVLRDFSADRIQGLSADLLNRVNAQLRLGALGQIDVETLIGRVADIVPPNRSTGLGSATRAETIVITEIGRVHSMASFQRLQQALTVRPDLMKEWLHSGLPRNARDGHVAMSRTRLPVNTPFQVSPVLGGLRESMQFPRVATASARNTVRCRCVVVPFLPEFLV